MVTVFFEGKRGIRRVIVELETITNCYCLYLSGSFFSDSIITSNSNIIYENILNRGSLFCWGAFVFLNMDLLWFESLILIELCFYRAWRSNFLCNDFEIQVNAIIFYVYTLFAWFFLLLICEKILFQNIVWVYGDVHYFHWSGSLCIGDLTMLVIVCYVLCSCDLIESAHLVCSLQFNSTLVSSYWFVEVQCWA